MEASILGNIKFRSNSTIRTTQMLNKRE